MGAQQSSTNSSDSSDLTSDKEWNSRNIKDILDKAKEQLKSSREQKKVGISLVTHVSLLTTPGYDFKKILPFLLECMDYAQQTEHEELKDATYTSLEWGSTWYISSLSELNSSETEDSKEMLQKNTPLTLENLKDILTSTKGMNEKLMYELASRLKLTKDKEELIEQGHIILPNDKKCKKDDKCTSKTILSATYTQDDFCAKFNNNKECHKNKECCCYCSCEKCWHTVCTVITY